MSKHKRLTELAMQKQREAAITRICADDRSLPSVDYQIARNIEAEAAALLIADEPPITNRGEVTQPHIAGLPGRYWIKNTLLDGDMVSEEASISRTDLLCQNNTDISALAVDAADSVGADNSLEKMLAHQMALAHEMAMKMGNEAMGELQKVRQMNDNRNGLHPGAASELQRLTNSVARLMATYQQGMLTLQRIKTGGNQTVTVQHVNVGAGGQAIVGNVQAGGGREGRKAKRG